jgi:hypothetical protein
MNRLNKYVYVSNKIYKLMEQNICIYKINYRGETKFKEGKRNKYLKRIINM